MRGNRSLPRHPPLGGVRRIKINSYKSDSPKKRIEKTVCEVKVEIGWKRLSISLFLILVSVSSYSAYHNVFGAPSGQIGSIEGGGYCSGDYTGYNNTIDNKLYVMNCSTGVNDISAQTDFGAMFNSLRSSTPDKGFTLNLRAGYYAAVTTAIFNTACGNTNLCDTAISLTGTYGGVAEPGWTLGNGTVIVAKTASMTMIEAGPWSPTVSCGNSGCGATDCSGTFCPEISGNLIQNLMLNPNGLANVGIDFRMRETSTNNRFLNIYTGTNIPKGGFKTVAMVLDGNEDSLVDNGYFAGSGPGNSGANLVDLQWQVPLGNINIIHTLFGGNLSLTAWAQIISVTQSTINNLKILGTCAVCGTILDLTDDYLANGIGTPGIIQLNGQTIDVLHISGDTVGLSSTISLFSGTGTVKNALYAWNEWSWGAGTNWNPGGATLTHQVSDAAVPPTSGATSPGTNHVRLGTAVQITNFPFTIDANGNF